MEISIRTTYPTRARHTDDDPMARVHAWAGRGYGEISEDKDIESGQWRAVDRDKCSG